MGLCFFRSNPMASPCFIDWTGYNDPAGPCWNCFHNNCEPCCGEPCNPLDGLYCFLCFWCCGPCVMCKWWASQLDQPCALVNHVLPVFVAMIFGVTCLFGWLLRYNGRMEAGVTENPDSIDKYLGDFFLSCLLAQLLVPPANNAVLSLSLIGTVSIWRPTEPSLPSSVTSNSLFPLLVAKPWPKLFPV